MKAIVIGATGATGKELIKLLINDPKVSEIITLVRRPVESENSKLKYVTVDFKNPLEWSNLVVGDVAFSCMGTTLKDAGSKQAQYEVDFGYQYEFAKAAKKNGIPSFILISSQSADSGSKIFYSRIKGELEDRVKELGFDKFVILRPGPLMRPDSDRLSEKISTSIITFFNKLGLLKSFAPLGVDKLAMQMLKYYYTTPQGVSVIDSKRLLSEIDRE